MRIAITFSDDANHERCENKHDHSLFGRSEAVPLPRLIQFGPPVLLQPTFRSQFLAGSFHCGRTIALNSKGGISQGEASSKTQATSKSGKLGSFTDYLGPFAARPCSFLAARSLFAAPQ